jgi:hypothetical protein
MARSKAILGIVAVILGVVALGLAIIPRALFEIPPPWPTQPAPKPYEVVEGGKTYEWKNAKVTVGGTKRVIFPPPANPPTTTSKVVYIATSLVALAGIAVGLVASWREQSYLLGGPAIVMCSAALLWHYIVLGVAVGFAIFVLFIFLSQFLAT